MLFLSFGTALLHFILCTLCKVWSWSVKKLFDLISFDLIHYCAKADCSLCGTGHSKACVIYM